MEINSLLKVSRFNDMLELAAKLKQPREFVPGIINEGETGILFADTGTGKSTLALQAAAKVAEEYPEMTCLYYDFELSDLQLFNRYGGKIKKMPSNLLLSRIDYDNIQDVKQLSELVENIESQICRIIESKLNTRTETTETGETTETTETGETTETTETGETTETALLEQHQNILIVLDNITYICANTKDGADAAQLMLKLKRLQKKYEWTILVIAHVPKRDNTNPLTINDLGGSKMLSNFADFVTGLNKSAKSPDTCYLKQLKSRSSSIIYDENNVLELTRTDEGGWLHFIEQETEPEIAHLPRTRNENKELEIEVCNLLQTEMSYSQIASRLNIDKSKVCRIAKRNGMARNS